MKTLMVSIAVAATAVAAVPASAQMVGTFYTVPADGKDFGAGNITGVIANAVQTNLGPNDRPIATSNLGAKDVNDLGELQWWQPSNYAGTIVTTGNSYSNPNFYPDNSPTNTGSDQNGLFRTAIFNGTFTTATAGTYNFTLGSDDDSFLYVDRMLVAQLGGVHGVATTDYSVNLGAGAHNFQLFYADRQPTGAVLNFALPANVTSTTAVPEPATWAMMLLGFGMIGFGMRYRRKGTKVSFA